MFKYEIRLKVTVDRKSDTIKMISYLLRYKGIIEQSPKGLLYKLILDKANIEIIKIIKKRN